MNSFELQDLKSTFVESFWKHHVKSAPAESSWKHPIKSAAGESFWKISRSIIAYYISLVFEFEPMVWYNYIEYNFQVKAIWIKKKCEL